MHFNLFVFILASFLEIGSHFGKPNYRHSDGYCSLKGRGWFDWRGMAWVRRAVSYTVFSQHGDKKPHWNYIGSSLYYYLVLFLPLHLRIEHLLMLKIAFPYCTQICKHKNCIGTFYHQCKSEQDECLKILQDDDNSHRF